MTYYLLKTPPPNTITLILGFQYMSFEGWAHSVHCRWSISALEIATAPYICSFYIQSSLDFLLDNLLILYSPLQSIILYIKCSLFKLLSGFCLLTQHSLKQNWCRARSLRQTLRMRFGNLFDCAFGLEHTALLLANGKWHESNPWHEVTSQFVKLS